MSRHIDRLASPGSVKKTKVVVASCSRTGTMSLYHAMQILGYTPYHLLELFAIKRLPHMDLFIEGVTAATNRLSGIKPYGRPEMEKWLAEYDCFIELPSYLGIQTIAACADDPETKFILMERSPDAWVRSFNNTFGEFVRRENTFHTRILRYFDKELDRFLGTAETLYGAKSGGTHLGQPDNEEQLRGNYVEYIRSVKERLPQDRLLVLRLEDGMGWEQICPFLELPIPSEPFPPPFVVDEFKVVADDLVTPLKTAARRRLGALAALALAGLVGWRYLRV